MLSKRTASLAAILLIPSAFAPPVAKYHGDGTGDRDGSQADGGNETAAGAALARREL
jgi:hypothetical protein